ncbi:hypothetical protein THF1D04_10888 [Vibrio owensii]|uniref:Uncharacterized protein n=1 Tax=Vibrio owensii TaxID=696485 RepID=A0AAU9PZ00_9VIBR|nr:hypothetical protein THF1D04_10888 [Vibrio owensii]
MRWDLIDLAQGLWRERTKGVEAWRANSNRKLGLAAFYPIKKGAHVAPIIYSNSSLWLEESDKRINLKPILRNITTFSPAVRISDKTRVMSSNEVC